VEFDYAEGVEGSASLQRAIEVVRENALNPVSLVAVPLFNPENGCVESPSV